MNCPLSKWRQGDPLNIMTPNSEDPYWLITLSYDILLLLLFFIVSFITIIWLKHLFIPTATSHNCWNTSSLP